MPFLLRPPPPRDHPALKSTAEDVAEGDALARFMVWREMMKLPRSDVRATQMLAEIAATQRAGKTVGGH